MSNSVYSRSDIGTSDEYKIKAAYLYNLIKFIQWPKDDKLLLVTRVCIIGSNSILKPFTNLSHRKVKGRPIEIHYQSDSGRLDRCNMLFIPSDYSNPENLLSLISSSAILTVGEKPSFLEQGGIVSLIVASNKIQLHINQSQAKSNGFEISGNLLEVARIVK
jgi:hypothetical protein